MNIGISSGSPFCKYLWFVILGPVLVFTPRAFAQQTVEKINQTEVRSTVLKLAELVNKNYFDVDVAQKVSRDLNSRLKDGKYKDIGTASELAERLTDHLFEATKDKHLVVEANNAKTETSGQQDDTPQKNSRELSGLRSNWGIQKAEILPGNIGYLNTTSFFRANEAREALASAMGLLANADAIIIDMRNNMGGSPSTVALLSSYFFETPEFKLFDIVPRSGEANTFLTDATVKHRSASRPVFVLTASDTFSGGEGFAFIMQDQRRAVVVGEKTAGAANPGRPYEVNNLFTITIPNGKIRAANNGGNWEGKGVAPDVQVDDQTALDVAHRLALKKLIEKTADLSWRRELENVLKSLNAK